MGFIFSFVKLYFVIIYLVINFQSNCLLSAKICFFFSLKTFLPKDSKNFSVTIDYLLSFLSMMNRKLISINMEPNPQKQENTILPSLSIIEKCAAIVHSFAVYCAKFTRPQNMSDAEYKNIKIVFFDVESKFLALVDNFRFPTNINFILYKIPALLANARLVNT